MKKILLILIPLLLVPVVFAETELRFSDDFSVDGNEVTLKGTEKKFELPKNIEEELGLPENIELKSIYIYLINDTPMINIELIAHINFYIFTYSPEIKATINTKTQEVTDLELPWFARVFEEKILRIIQKETNSAELEIISE